MKFTFPLILTSITGIYEDFFIYIKTYNVCYFLYLGFKLILFKLSFKKYLNKKKKMFDTKFVISQVEMVLF